MPCFSLKFWRQIRIRRKYLLPPPENTQTIENAPILLEGSSIEVATQHILKTAWSSVWHDGPLRDHVLKLAELARNLPLLEPSMIQESELTETRAIIRNIREIGETLEHDIEKLRRTHIGPAPFDPYISRERQWELVDRIRPTIALLEAQRPHVPQTVNQVFRMEALLHFSLGLPLPVCWQILDLAEYWAQIVDHVEFARHLGSDEPDTWAVTLSIPQGAAGFRFLRKVVVAVAGHNQINREAMTDQGWESFEIQTGGDLPSRSVTFVNHQPYFEQEIPPIHVFRWDYGVSMGNVEDDKKTQQALRSFRPNDHFTVSITAPSHRGWWDHVVMLRTELYYSCV